MKMKTDRHHSIAERLRQSAPPLRAPDLERAAAACQRIASAPPVSPLREPHTFLRPLLRVAACLALMAGIAVLMRQKPKRPVDVPSLPTVATFHDLTTLSGAHTMEDSLAHEASDLASDLAGLTAVLNERTLAILF